MDPYTHMEEEYKLTGKSQKYVSADIKKFEQERVNDKQLKMMSIEDYEDENGITNSQIKRLIITGSQYPYLNRKIKIRIEFPDEYPQIPIRMFVQKTNGKDFLHANVYNNLNDICHPLLQKNKKQKNIKFTFILKKINDLLYNPNFSNAANCTLKKIHASDKEKYKRMIQQNASLLQKGSGLEFEESSQSDDD